MASTSTNCPNSSISALGAKPQAAAGLLRTPTERRSGLMVRASRRTYNLAMDNSVSQRRLQSGVGIAPNGYLSKGALVSSVNECENLSMAENADSPSCMQSFSIPEKSPFRADSLTARTRSESPET